MTRYQEISHVDTHMKYGLVSGRGLDPHQRFDLPHQRNKGIGGLHDKGPAADNTDSLVLSFYDQLKSINIIAQLQVYMPSHARSFQTLTACSTCTCCTCT